MIRANYLSVNDQSTTHQGFFGAIEFLWTLQIGSPQDRGMKSEAPDQIEVIDLERPWVVSVPQMEAAIQKAIGQEYNSVGLTEIYLPSMMNLEAAVQAEDLQTLWDSPLEGLRISNFKNTGLRILERRAGKVTWSKDLNKVPTGLYREILSQFLEFIASKALEFSTVLALPDTHKLLFPLPACTDLLKKTFLATTKPRVIPKLRWPDQEDCITALDKAIGSWPWKREDFSGLVQLSLEDSKYCFEVRGERGALEMSYKSVNQDEVLWKAFQYFVRYDYFELDANFGLDHFYFSAD